MEYERRLVALIPQSDSGRRVEICLLLGKRHKATAVPHLIALSNTDPDSIVRAAALQALGDITGQSLL